MALLGVQPVDDIGGVLRGGHGHQYRAIVAGSRPERPAGQPGFQQLWRISDSRPVAGGISD
ncbi:hypothetical protein D3C72_2581880 [compost metagenome]